MQRWPFLAHGNYLAWTEAKFDYRAALLPIPQEGATRASALGEGDNVILAKSEHPKEAFILLEFLYSKMPDVWNRFGFVPACKCEVE